MSATEQRIVARLDDASLTAIRDVVRAEVSRRYDPELVWVVRSVGGGIAGIYATEAAAQLAPTVRLGAKVEPWVLQP